MTVPHNNNTTGSTTAAMMNLKRKAVDNNKSKIIDGGRKKGAAIDCVSASGDENAIISPTTAAATGATKTNRNDVTKKLPILLILPGSGGKLSKDFKELLLPALHQRFEVRLRKAKKWKGWKEGEGWDPMKNAIDFMSIGSTTENLVPTGDTDEAEDWYIMGCSYGNRVATAIAALEHTSRGKRLPPKLILTGYPMYGHSSNNKDARVLSLQSLPMGTHVLAISGTNDHCITSDKNVPHPLPSGNPRTVWDTVLQKMSCRATTTVRFIENGGHGVYPTVKERKAATTTQLEQYIDTFVNGGDNDDDDPTIPTGGVGSDGGNTTSTSFFQHKQLLDPPTQSTFNK